MAEILVLYYTRTGATQAMAELIAHGIESVEGMHARIRTVPPVSTETHPSKDPVPTSGPPYVTKQDLKDCVGLALGSPTRFGNMAAPLKFFWDTTAGEWFAGALAGKPACVFTSTSTMHGGQETTLLSMMMPLIHHGMIIVGVPYTESALIETQTGGTPYGVSHLAGPNSDKPLSPHEQKLSIAQGVRLANIAKKLM